MIHTRAQEVKVSCLPIVKLQFVLLFINRHPKAHIRNYTAYQAYFGIYSRYTKRGGFIVDEEPKKQRPKVMLNISEIYFADSGFRMRTIFLPKR